MNPAALSPSASSTDLNNGDASVTEDLTAATKQISEEKKKDDASRDKVRLPFIDLSSSRVVYSVFTPLCTQLINLHPVSRKEPCQELPPLHLTQPEDDERER
ncbi:hypothetical protein Q8A73_009385 [Channa argus]|nr:hypothetical protein Q8A73_009385 [Channa argus]